MSRDREPVPGLDRRDLLRAVGAGAAATAVAGAATGADGPEGNPLAGFGGTSCDTTRTSDEYLPFDTGGDYGGWGGHDYHGTRPGIRTNPVVFVHGNTHDGCDFSIHAEAYLERGYRGDELWSITFAQSSPNHTEMARQLDDFVANVRAETGADAVDVVSHSLGVTGVRFWLLDLRPYLEAGRWPSVTLSADHPAAEPHLDVVDTFVGLAGANHGTYTCGPCQKGTGSARPCNVISPLCADQPGDTLYDMNHYCPDAVGADCPVNETPGDVDYYTIRGGLDYFYTDQSSPTLAGAEANVYLQGRAHNATRASGTAVELIYQWVGAAPPGRPEKRVVLDASGSRSDGADAYTAGQTARIDLAAETDGPSLLRDRIPYHWDVLDVDGDDVEAVAIRPHEGVKEVYLAERPAKDHAATYFVEAPASSGQYEFGPIQVRAPQATVWQDVSGTTDSAVVVGANTEL